MTVAGGGACFKPDVVDGKLLCSTGGTCPDGFHCIADHCWRGGVAVVDAGDASSTETACEEPVPGCVPIATGVCDPVCQTGCACHEKCTISSDGVPACLPVNGQQTAGQSCSFNNYSAPNQNDNCAPGSVCLRPGGPGDAVAYCFKLCASDDACPGARCVARVYATAGAPGTLANAKVCDVPFVACNPFTNEGCPTDRSYCYLTTPDPITNASRTVCEYSTGTSGATGSCSWSRDCFGKLVCPRSEGAAGQLGAGFCQPPCDTANGCTVGTCQPYGSTYGYCVIN